MGFSLDLWKRQIWPRVPARLTGFPLPIRLLGSKLLLHAPSRESPISKSFEYAHMLMFEWILLLLFAAVVLTNLAERLAVPYPSLLAVAGTGLAFLALQRLRTRGEIGDEAFRRIQEELDWSELDAAPAGSFQSLAN